MKTRFGRLICLWLLLLSFGVAQEIPKGVRYKRASAAVNAKAKSSLRRVLNVVVPDKVILASLDAAVTCGPSLWSAIKRAAPSSVQKAAKATFIIPDASGRQELEGRVLRTPKERHNFWICVLAYHNKHKKATIRNANGPEISYYWAIIPYDIEEPLLVADYGKVRLLFHFRMEKGKPRIFFVDIVR